MPQPLRVIADILMPVGRHERAVVKFLGTCVKFFSFARFDHKSPAAVRPVFAHVPHPWSHRLHGTPLALKKSELAVRVRSSFADRRDGASTDWRRPLKRQRQQDHLLASGIAALEAEAMGEHTVEATSSHVLGSLSHRDEPWARCHDEVMAQMRDRRGMAARPIHVHVVPSSTFGWRSRASSHPRSRPCWAAGV